MLAYTVLKRSRVLLLVISMRLIDNLFGKCFWFVTGSDACDHLLNSLCDKTHVISCNVRAQREIQCFTQPTSLIAYRRRNKVKVSGGQDNPRQI